MKTGERIPVETIARRIRGNRGGVDIDSLRMFLHYEMEFKYLKKIRGKSSAKPNLYEKVRID